MVTHNGLAADNEYAGMTATDSITILALPNLLGALPRDGYATHVP